MFEKLKTWWRSRTQNEKMMYALIAVLVIGIATRAGFIWDEIAEAFGVYFGGRK